MRKAKTFLARAVAGAGVAAASLVGVDLQWPTAFADPAPIHDQIAAPPSGAPVSLADVVKRVSPAVVQIETRRRAPAAGGQGGEAQRSAEAPTAGSGFFISADGYIVATNDVVSGAEEITVTMSDKRELKAHVVGRDAATDLTVIKVDGKDFPFVEFETQAEPRVGDRVVVMGNALGLRSTARAGVVSAYGRDLGENYVDYIRIDAAISKGDAGGPTFDAKGHVIGVVAAMLKPNGRTPGAGFAVPARIADRVTRQLIATGKMEYGHAGITVGPVTDDIEKALGLSDTHGAFVAQVEPGGPAARAGVRAGDVIVTVNGQVLEHSGDVLRRAAETKPGEILHLDVLRAGKLVKVDVKVDPFSRE